MDNAERTLGGNICGLSTVRQDLYTLHERALQHCLRRWPLLFYSRVCKKKHDGCHIFPQRFRYAGHLLGKNPHAEAAVAGIETKFH